MDRIDLMWMELIGLKAKQDKVTLIYTNTKQFDTLISESLTMILLIQIKFQLTQRNTTEFVENMQYEPSKDLQPFTVMQFDSLSAESLINDLDCQYCKSIELIC